MVEPIPKLKGPATTLIVNSISLLHVSMHVLIHCLLLALDHIHVSYLHAYLHLLPSRVVSLANL